MWLGAGAPAPTFLDGREEAPRRFHGNVFCRDPRCLLDDGCGCAGGVVGARERKTGGLAAGVPGVVAAMARLAAEKGTRPLARLLAPAVGYARDGFVMYARSGGGGWWRGWRCRLLR